MKAIIFDIDHTIFDGEKLHEGVADLLAILRNLGINLGALTNEDHRAIVRLDEAGIRHYFADVLCNEQDDQPKSEAALDRLLEHLGSKRDQATLVSHAHADILLGKDAGLAKTIGVSHGAKNTSPLEEAGADHIVPDIPTVLDVLD
jgi:phosphoglycolate phosphatase-like HAD superfamily hydrolase